jgi:hypothetical protein
MYIYAVFWLQIDAQGNLLAAKLRCVLVLG